MSTDLVLSGLEQMRPMLEDTYQELHRHPELSMHETRTSQLIADRLDAMGYQVQRIGGGVVGVLSNGGGPTILLRADIDALPVKEATGLPYASTDSATNDAGETVSVMHACGHDVHITSLLGAAALMSQQKQQWHGTLEVLFQPGEEIAAGARSMVADGLVTKIPHPDVALAQHVLGVCPSGSVATTAGPVLSTAASVRVTIHGKGSHGSMPHLGVDPVVVASFIAIRLQTLVSREIAPSDFGVVTIGALHAGSSANVIPETATMLLNVRAYTDEVRHHLLAGIQRIVDAECQAAACPEPPEVEVYDSYPLTCNDDTVTRTVTDALVKVLGPARVETLAPQTASEDFSIIPDAFGIPYTYWGIGAFTPDQQAYPNHNPKFGPAMEPTLDTGVTAMVTAALAYLGK